MNDAARPSIGRGKAVGWSALFLAVGLGFSLALGVGGFVLARITGTGPSTAALIIQTAAGLTGFGIATWAVGMRGAGLTLRDLRWVPERGAGQGFGLGLVIGAVPAAVAVLASLVVGGAGFLPDTGGAAEYAAELGRTGALLLPAALAEEIMFRGVALVLLAQAFGRGPAIVALSALFAAAHGANPNSTPLALLNIALAGIFLSTAFYLPGGIWTAWGAHLGWNATLAAFDTPVSGLPFPIPWFDYQPGGPDWLTGGGFGPEGGLLATLAVLAATVILWQRMRKETV